MTDSCDQDERHWQDGYLAAWRRIFDEALRQLPEKDIKANAWIMERGAAVAALRGLCAEYGDNDWPDDLHLADIIEKHLGDFERQPARGAYELLYNRLLETFRTMPENPHGLSAEEWATYRGRLEKLIKDEG